MNLFIRVLEFFESRGKPFALLTGFFFISIVGFLDYATGYELAFSLFYLVPISLVTWGTSKRYGAAAAALGALVWLSADVSAGQSYTKPAIYFWNTAIRFCFFIFVVFLLSALKKSLEHEHELARTDPLTGAANSRLFMELLNREIDRSRRYAHSFTVAYFDLDDFKDLNDRLGHSAGDEALRVIVREVKANLRRTDIVARLGGDEFVLLLPETNQREARSVMSKLRRALLKSMREKRWQVGFSIGVLSCREPEGAPDQFLAAVDRLMYAAKRGGKNSAVYRSCRGDIRLMTL